MYLRSMQVAKGLHKLKILQRKQKLNKGYFIAALKSRGFAKIPDDLKVKRLPLAYQFYDPVPKMLELYASPSKIHRLQPVEFQS